MDSRWPTSRGLARGAAQMVAQGCLRRQSAKGLRSWPGVPWGSSQAVGAGGGHGDRRRRRRDSSARSACGDAVRIFGSVVPISLRLLCLKARPPVTAPVCARPPHCSCDDPCAHTLGEAVVRIVRIRLRRPLAPEPCCPLLTTSPLNHSGRAAWLSMRQLATRLGWHAVERAIGRNGGNSSTTLRDFVR